MNTALPVRLLSGGTGTTRNISASGIYFETDSTPLSDSPLEFSVEFERNGNGTGLTLRCSAQVVRIESLGDKIGIAARIVESKLAPSPGKQDPARLVVTDGFADSF